MPIYKVEGEKKDGLQKYNVRVNYTTIDGMPKQLTRVAYGNEAAKDLERILTVEKKSKEKPLSKLLLRELFNEYSIANKFAVRETTLDKYRCDFDLHIDPTMGGLRVSKLTPKSLQDWKSLIEEKGFILTTKKHIYGIFRAILNYAVKMEYIPSNPLKKVGDFKDSQDAKPEMKYYTADKFCKFIAISKQFAEESEIKKHDLSEWDYYVFFNIAFYTGLRKGEIHALKWSDITGSHLNVKRSISQKLRGEDRETPPKNKASKRTLQMPLPLITILNNHKLRQAQLEQFSDDYRICGGERCLRDTSIQNRNKQYATLADLETIRIHDFRHSHVSVLANARVNIQEIARRLGHTKIEMTWNTYSHLYPHEEEIAVDVLNKIT